MKFFNFSILGYNFTYIEILKILLYNVSRKKQQNGVKLVNLQQIDIYLEKKLKKNKRCVIFTFYELRVKLNLTSEETYNFLHLVSTKLENNNYKTYRTGQQYENEGKKYKVEDNQLLVAINQTNTHIL